MKTLLILVLLVLALEGAEGAEKLVDVTLSGAGSDGVLAIDAGSASSGRIVAEIEAPNITMPVYAVHGQVRYSEVGDAAWLQLDSHFGADGTFFTKSLADAGPLAKLAGSSDWRPFVLPFNADAGGKWLTPERLTLSVVVPGSGRVFLKDVELYQYAAGEEPLAADGQWFTARVAAIAGALGGTAIGLWGALVGMLASRGRARAFVFVSSGVLFVAGIAAAVAGLTALFIGQPYAVYYPLLLVGGILIFVIGFLRRSLPQRYEALEMRKMRAIDRR